MSYRRDFTIGLRETQDFYLYLVLRRWRNGVLGFGVVGGLVVWMYLNLLLPEAGKAVQAGAVILGAAAVMGIIVLFLVLSTLFQVRSKLRGTGQSSYIQAVEIDGFGIHVTAEKKKAKLPFDRLFRVQETKKAFYLFISDHQAWILPKAQMEDRAAECGQLRNIFSSVVESGKLSLKK